MINNVDYREACIKLIRTHQEQLFIFESEAIRKRQRLSYRNFQKIESLGDDASYIQKILTLRRQYLQVQRFKLHVQKERMEHIRKQALEMKELKATWGRLIA